MNHALETEGNAPDGRDIVTVTELNQAVHRLISDSFCLLWVDGEISNLNRAPSGHMYFSLKDEQSQVRCAMFASKNRLLDFRPKNGQRLLVRARVGVYQARGDYQLIVEDMEPCGEGALRLAYERLKKQLHQAGLFDKAHKRPVPSIPQHIGIITSPTGAAIQDILHVLERRFPQAQITVYPTLVQGKQAADNVCKALKQAQRHAQCDVLLLARGGGSIEDLWCFNEESVAQAIFSCSIPIVSGIGHEIDVTIADFVADLRAPTPSAAAEMATPDQAHLLREVLQYEKRLQATIEEQCSEGAQRLDTLWQRLSRLHPEFQLAQMQTRLHKIRQALPRVIYRLQSQHVQRFDVLALRLQQLLPATLAQKNRLNVLSNRLLQAMITGVQSPQYRLQLAAKSLHAMSPLATLGRGYALVTHAQGGRLVTAARQLKQGDLVAIRLRTGGVECAVRKTIL